MLRRTTSTIFLITWIYFSYGQSTFVHRINTTYGYSSQPRVFKAIETYDGSIVCVGRFEGNTPDFVRGFITKRTSTGNEAWTKTFGNNVGIWLIDDPVDLLETKDSCYLIVCRSWHADVNGDYTDGLYLVKFNQNGDTIFHKRYINNISEIWGPENLVELDDGSLHGVFNPPYSFTADSTVMQIVSFDKNGNVAAMRAFISPARNRCSQLLIYDNFFYLFGSTTGFDTTSLYPYYLFVSKIDTAGNIIWSYSYKSLSDSLQPYKFLCSNGQLLIAGKDLHSQGVITMIIDSSGVPVSGKRMDNFYHRDVCLGADSGLVWAGRCFWGNYFIRSDFGLDSIVLFRAPDFNLAIELNSDRITLTNNRGILAGAGNWNLDSTFYLLKTDSLYETACLTDSIQDSISISPHTISTDTLVFLPSAPTGIYTYYQFPYTGEFTIDMGSTIDMCNLVSIRKPSSDELNLHPNPFQNSATLYLPKEFSSGYLIIFNSIGVRVSENIITSSGSYIMNREMLPEGIYFYEIISEGNFEKYSGRFIIY